MFLYQLNGRENIPKIQELASTLLNAGRQVKKITLAQESPKIIWETYCDFFRDHFAPTGEDITMGRHLHSALQDRFSPKFHFMDKRVTGASITKKTGWHSRKPVATIYRGTVYLFDKSFSNDLSTTNN